MNEKADWEIVDDNPQPKQQFSQRDFLYALLGKYPRLKLAGLVVTGVLTIALVALFSVVVVASVTLASIIVLLAAWCKATFFKHKKNFPVHVAGK